MKAPPIAPAWATVTFDDEDLQRWSHLVGQVPADIGRVTGGVSLPVEIVQRASGLIFEPLRVDTPKIRVGDIHLHPGDAVRLARYLTGAVTLLDDTG